MKERTRERIARLVATVGSFAAFPELLTFRGIYFPDDGFTSDIVNGELPARVLLGRMLRDGHLPLWTKDLGGGYPIGVGLLGEPLSNGLFALFSPAVALGLFVATLLTIASQGTYGFARRVGAEPSGAAFAAIAFSGSGYLVSQLRHLGILATVVWIPVALYLLDRAFSFDESEGATRGARRVRDSALFGLVVAEQGLSGFPQSLFISGLVYLAYAAALSVAALARTETRRQALGTLGALALSGALGLAGSAIVVLPLSDLAETASRGTEFNWFWIHRLGYTPTNLANFFVPYLYGDASTMTYRNGGLFWEIYGYAGLSTAGLFVLGVFHNARRLRSATLLGIVLFALLAVLGPNSPLFPVLWKIPGMNAFRFWTRFLVVVNLGMAVLAGLSLTELLRWLSARTASRAPSTAPLVAVAVVGSLMVDLFVHQRRQNPFAPADLWLARPKTAEFLAKEPGHVRVHSLGQRHFHQRAHREARGWSTPAPYAALVPALAPNLPALYGIPSIDVYAGVALPHWQTLFGDHVKPALVPPLVGHRADGLVVPEEYVRLLRLVGVTHVLSPEPVSGGSSLGEPAFASEGGYVHRVPGASRAYHAPEARSIPADALAIPPLLAGALEDRRLVLIDEASSLPAVSPGASGPLEVEDVSPTHVRIDVSGLGTGYVYLADAFFPGWQATLDGRPLELARANVFGRAVALDRPGRVLEFRFTSAPFELGALLSGLSLTSLLGLLAVASLRARRESSGALRSRVAS